MKNLWIIELFQNYYDLYNLLTPATCSLFVSWLDWYKWSERHSVKSGINLFLQTTYTHKLLIFFSGVGEILQQDKNHVLLYLISYWNPLD